MRRWELGSFNPNDNVLARMLISEDVRHNCSIAAATTFEQSNKSPTTFTLDLLQSQQIDSARAPNATPQHHCL